MFSAGLCRIVTQPALGRHHVKVAQMTYLDVVCIYPLEAESGDVHSRFSATTLLIGNLLRSTCQGG